MPTHLQEDLALHAETLAAWRELRAAAREIEDPAERAAALEALKGKRPTHPYLGGLSLTALRQGNRRLLTPLRARTADARAEHAQTLAAWKERRAEAQKIKDPEQRGKAIDALGERPKHPVLVAAGCAVVCSVLLAGVPAVRHYAPVAITSGLTLWAIAALILGQNPDHAQRPAPAEPAPQNTPGTDPREPPEEPAEEPSEGPEEDVEEEPSPTVPTPTEARHAVAVLGADGAHVALTAVTARLAAAHPRWERSAKATKALLQGAGIRYRDGVKVDGVSVPGVHHDDVPPLPSPSERTPGPVVVPGQSNNNNHNNAQQHSSREGFVMRADPDNPARTIVVNRTAAA
ncbi:hypothetical protein ACFRMQ_08435 [Kitasatospora sp. NPDC056783]|uniref:hypothetical protein n=1 Tax=Kitasatospora sp. NPDC056783 TaxID=3345943 RepID=UPI00367CD012